MKVKILYILVLLFPLIYLNSCLTTKYRDEAHVFKLKNTETSDVDKIDKYYVLNDSLRYHFGIEAKDTFSHGTFSGKKNNLYVRLWSKYTKELAIDTINSKITINGTKHQYQIWSYWEHVFSDSIKEKVNKQRASHLTKPNYGDSIARLNSVSRLAYNYLILPIDSVKIYDIIIRDVLDLYDYKNELANSKLEYIVVGNDISEPFYHFLPDQSPLDIDINLIVKKADSTAIIIPPIRIYEEYYSKNRKHWNLGDYTLFAKTDYMLASRSVIDGKKWSWDNFVYKGLPFIGFASLVSIPIIK